MAASLPLIVLLFGLVMSTPSQSLNDVGRRLASACLDGASRSPVHQELKSGQQRMQEQLSALLEQLTALQKQMTALQEQPTAPQPDPEDSAPACPTSWSRLGHSCYRIPPKRTTWFLAHDACAKLDGRAHLASVHQESSQRISSLMVDSGASHVWVGLSRHTGDASWVWTDDTPLDLTNWAQGQPNNYGGMEKCVRVHSSGLWYDNDCSTTLHILCQISRG